MTSPSISGAAPIAVPRPAHRAASPGAGPQDASVATGSPANAPVAGFQTFASELQSILLSAQAGRPTAAGTTAADPTSATDPTAAPARHVANRLQALLGDGAAAGGSGLNDVLDRLQQNLSRTLQGYAAAGATPTSSITA